MLNADMEIYNEILNLNTRKYIVISGTEATTRPLQAKSEWRLILKLV